MRSRTIAIQPLADPMALTSLALDAEADGHRMVSRLIEEWNDGRNCFNLPGEQAYVAVSDGEVVGVCGLNVDPFANDARVARVRRLYVKVAERRKGVASALIQQLAGDAQNGFHTLQLRTYDPQASAFYEAMGFARVTDDPNCTHRRAVARATGECAANRPGG